MERVKMNGKEYDVNLETQGNSLRVTVTENKQEEVKGYHVGQKVKLQESPFYLGFPTPSEAAEKCYGIIKKLEHDIAALDIYRKSDNVQVRPNSGWWFLYSCLAPWVDEKQDIREYCKEHRVWAAKDDGGPHEWCLFKEKPYIQQKEWVLDNLWININSAPVKAKFTFPDCPWDKSLIAPDGSMPLMEKKEFKPKHGWIVGHLYENTSCWGNDKRVCVEVTDGGQGYVDRYPRSKGGIPYLWDNNMKDITPKRGDPIFVWDNGASDKIPASVRYFKEFHEASLYSVQVYSETTENDYGTCYNNYRLFDVSLVGVPRKDWDK